jgi:hypothetical protein
MKQGVQGMKLHYLAASIALAALGFGTSARACDAPDVIELPAGQACEFPLRVEICGGPQFFREFTDANGNVVRTILAGRGSELTFINLTTKALLVLPSNGSVFTL